METLVKNTIYVEK